MRSKVLPSARVRGLARATRRWRGNAASESDADHPTTALSWSACPGKRSRVVTEDKKPRGLLLAEEGRRSGLLDLERRGDSVNGHRIEQAHGSLLPRRQSAE